MTIDEAIDQLVNEEAEDEEMGLTIAAQAKRLGSEALARHKHQQKNLPSWGRKPLPSETE